MEDFFKGLGRGILGFMLTLLALGFIGALLIVGVLLCLF